MRSRQTVFKRFLNVRLRKFRYSRGYTQERMAEPCAHFHTRIFRFGTRQYSASALTLLFFMSELNEAEALALLSDFHKLMLSALSADES